MKNREKYKNELMDVVNKEGNICEFMIKHGVSKMFGKDMESFCGETECTSCHTALQLWLDEEYEEPEVDWSKVPVDTLVRVWDNRAYECVLRYFKGIDDSNPTRKYVAWAKGATSVTAYGQVTHWKHCEMVEDTNDCN